MATTLERTAPFINEIVKNFSDPADAAAMRAALDSVKAGFGKHYPLVIGGKRIETEKKIRSLNPADPSQVVGVTSSASKEQAAEAIEAAARAFESWKRVPPQERAECIFKAAELLRRGGSNTTRCSCTRSARAGQRPTATSPKRSTFSSSTRARRCATRDRIPSYRSKASATR